MSHWNSKIAEETLLEIKTHALQETTDTINWYTTKRSSMGCWARFIRVATIVLLCISTLIPLIAALPCFKDEVASILYIGYFMAGLGGALLLADKYYGLSNSWVRFVLTGSDLKNMQDSFIENWEILYINNLPLTPTNFNTLAKYIIDYKDLFNKNVKKETEEWAKEFQQSGKELMKELQTNMEDSKSNFETEMHKLASKKASIFNSGVDESKYTKNDYANIAIDQNQNFLYNKFKNIRLITHGKKINEQTGQLVDCVTIHLTDDEVEQIPSKLFLKTSEGVTQEVETEIIESVDKPRVSYMAGDSIANTEIQPIAKGSIACKLQLPDKTECILTCCHVMTGGRSTCFDNRPVSSLLNSIISGIWFYGVRDSELDIALIKDFDPKQVNFPSNLTVTDARDLTIDDIKTTKVTMFGRLDFYAPPNGNGSAIEGYIINNRCVNPVTISYEGEDCPMINLITISKSNKAPFESISQGGDSGSLIIDSITKEMLGIVIAQNSKFTYAISFNKILKKLQIK
ncbi:SLATT domain-containing protein [Dyadobacter frigoris]|nr:SLATT domain-containing protein [Dyadobacter frigoris]